MSHFGWCVVGAGPAGIAIVGKLVDAGIPPKKIAWIDPEFNVGDLGKKWYRIRGNTKVKTFIDFMNECASFEYHNAPKFAIDAFDREQSCRLGFVAEPLLWITEKLKRQVTVINGTVKDLRLSNGHWHVKLKSEQTIESKQVVLATGAYPEKLSCAIPEIPLEVALNDESLASESLENETVGVFGSSHSAMVVLENLLECESGKVINFFRNPLKYAVYLEEFTLFDNTGLKGHAASWAKSNIDGQWPEKLERVHCESDDFDTKLSECSKVIYAVGFSKKNEIAIQPFPHGLPHNPCNGIIAPGLFGMGIAYPQNVTDPFGNTEANVGIWKFMKQVKKCLPMWMAYHA